MQPSRSCRLLTVLALAGALSTGSAVAQTVDMSRGSCSDFTRMGEEDRNQLALWLAGYYAGLAQRPLLDLDKVLAAPGELTTLCTEKPDLPLVGPETRAIFFPPAP
jgi:hypothetical protein